MKEFMNIDTHTKIVTVIYLVVLIGISVYFLKNFKTIDVQLKLILVVLFCSFLLFIYDGIDVNKNVRLLKNNFSLTSGNIEEYFIPKLRGRGANKSIKYIYKVNDEFFENQYQGNYYVAIPEDKPDLSLLYLVIYEKTNPKNSYILINYPINNADDLDKYRKLFEEKIPDDAIKPD